MHGGIDPGKIGFYPQVVGVVDSWNDLVSGDGALSSPGGADSTNPSSSAIGRWGWSFHTVRGGIDAGDHCLSPRVVGVAEIMGDFRIAERALSSSGAAGLGGSPEGQLLPSAPRPVIGRGWARVGLGQWDWDSENAGIKAIRYVIMVAGNRH